MPPSFALNRSVNSIVSLNTHGPHQHARHSSQKRYLKTQNSNIAWLIHENSNGIKCLMSTSALYTVCKPVNTDDKRLPVYFNAFKYVYKQLLLLSSRVHPFDLIPNTCMLSNTKKKQLSSLPVFSSRCCRFVRRTWEQIFVSISTGRFLKSIQLSVWPATGASERSPWSSRPSTVLLATWSTTLAKVWTASVLWCRDHSRSFRTTRWWPF